MADWPTDLGHGIDTLVGYLGVTGAHRFEAALYIFIGVVVILACIEVPKVIRLAQLGGAPRKQRRNSMRIAELAQ
jgi:1,4-dihydroxy-2-naphthoate octaprenyltransferase